MYRIHIQLDESQCLNSRSHRAVNGLNTSAHSPEDSGRSFYWGHHSLLLIKVYTHFVSMNSTNTCGGAI